jgi:hypothetical protein
MFLQILAQRAPRFLHFQKKLPDGESAEALVISIDM